MILLNFTNIELVSVNALYVNLRGQSRRFLAPKARVSTAAIRDIVRAANLDVAPLLNQKLRVTITVGCPTWLTKAKTIRKKDIASYEKMISDSIFAELRELDESLDDSQIFELTLIKRVTDPAESEFFTYQIEVM